jgi:hypothetical protein
MTKARRLPSVENQYAVSVLVPEGHRCLLPSNYRAVMRKALRDGMAENGDTPAGTFDIVGVTPRGAGLLAVTVRRRGT